jgi:hypothetical protein
VVDEAVLRKKSLGKSKQEEGKGKEEKSGQSQWQVFRNENK